MNMDMSWIWPFTEAMLILMLITMIILLILKFMGKFPKRKDARIDNKTIMREVFKELSSSAKANRLPRIKNIMIKPSEWQLPKTLGKYKGHVPDKRVLILRIKKSRVPFSKHILLLIPYVFLSSDKNKPLDTPGTMPLTVKNLELYIEGIQKYGWFWTPLVRKDYGVKQEVVDTYISRWMETHTRNRYLIEELPPEHLKGPVYAASTSPETERRIILEKPPMPEEEKEVPE